MPMTIIVTNQLPERFRGFLASCMLELAPGVYSSPRMNVKVRETLWQILVKWFCEKYTKDASILMLWDDKTAPGGQGVLSLGLPQRTVVDCDGLLLSRLSEKEAKEEKEANDTFNPSDFKIF